MGVSNLTYQKCMPCEGGEYVPMTPAEAEVVRVEHTPGWRLVPGLDDGTGMYLARSYNGMGSYKDAEAFIILVGVIAEEEYHHPDVEFGWGYAFVKIMTHAIEGLSINDFILAAKIEDLI